MNPAQLLLPGVPRRVGRPPQFTPEERKERIRNQVTAAVRRYAGRNPDKIKKSNAEQYAKLRKQLFDAYGWACMCCGEKIKEFLTIDHVNNDGAEHRRITGGGSAWLREIRKLGFPPGFQTLCFNCNAARGLHGKCPHEV